MRDMAVPSSDLKSDVTTVLLDPDFL